MLIVGRAPFDGNNDEEIFGNIESGQFNANHKKLLAASNEVQDLVKKLLQIDVKKRLSAAEALKHPWFKKFNAKIIYKNISSSKIKLYLGRLLEYQINSKLQQMVLAFIVHNLGENEETKDVLKIFRLFNDNDDGKLTKEELMKGLSKYEDENKISKSIDDIFLLLDGANRGFIEFEEFLRACVDKKKILNEETLVYAFNFFVKDGSSKISADKIKANFIGSNVSEKVFQSILNEIDSNHDGEIDFSEFKDMMLQ